MEPNVISAERKTAGDFFSVQSFFPEICESGVSYQKYRENIVLRGESHIEGNSSILWSVGGLLLS